MKSETEQLLIAGGCEEMSRKIKQVEKLTKLMDKPFILFAGDTYYPAPGWHNYDGDFATLEAACKSGKAGLCAGEWWQVVDLNTKRIVAGEGEGYTGLFELLKAGCEDDGTKGE